MRSTFYIRFFLSLLGAMAVMGCESIHYYSQAIHGQAAILTKRRPIDRLLAEPGTPERLKIKLRQVLNLREFAANELSLPVDDHYLTYVALDRPSAVWTIFAAPEFSFTPKTWRYPFVGRTAYRGYFSEKSARLFAKNLQKEGWDVHVGRVAAYSTLGWFDDPILSTIIDRSQAGLAALIFHELAHQVLYVNDDTTFNESFATAVEEEGVRRWSMATKNDRAYEEHQIAHRRRLAFNALVIKYRDRLDRLYQNDMPAHGKRHQKASILAALRADYQRLKQQWQGYSGYDRWFRESINNAKINAVSTYHELVPAFRGLIQSEGENLERFYHTCRQLAQKPKRERRRELENTIRSHPQPLVPLRVK